MYLAYAHSKGLSTEILSSDFGWFSFAVHGKNNSCFKTLQNEAGKHVVQRKPSNGKGKKHTSTVSVAVLPLVNYRTSPLQESDVYIKTQGGSGPGGQHQNKTESAVRITHKPTGIQVYINGKSQHQNRQKAMQILAQRVAAQEVHEKQQKLNQNRKQQIRGGSRSGKRRTYNMTENRVTDHDTGQKIKDVKRVLKGNLDCIKE